MKITTNNENQRDRAKRKTTQKENELKPARVAAEDSLPTDVADAIKDLLSFIWDQHFLNASEAEFVAEKERIFRAHVTVDNWLFGNNSSLEPWEGDL